ncbi:galactokinase [Dactylosporangium vinaceum]|uniref:Galactokinase n=1 Tax=Dactylosporangium vinaceum TaxID=53362 RepID=A0ABV5LYV1_9ACTN|nr:galactokinase [Dactylosporangium vinaceum]UAB95232.1 galactokinase [Dactylosporangium vinaceum]
MSVERLPDGPFDSVWASPGRVNLIGEHTDYNDGFVLPFALPHCTVVGGRRRDTPSWTVTSEGYEGAVTFGPDEKVEGWAAYVAGVVWALREAGHDIPGAELSIVSDVPTGAGLSSSAAIECAVMAVLLDLAGLDVPMAVRPRLAQRAENEYVGAPTGIMDQSASTLGRTGHALFLDCRSLATEQVPFDLAAQGLAILVVDSKAPHAHVTGEYAARRRSCEEAAKILDVAALRDVTDLDGALARLDDEVMRRRVRHVVTENQRVLDTVDALRAGDAREIGPLMTASHTSMRDDYEITVPQVDTVVDAALAAGAYGARMTGGGFGGCVLALVDADRCDAVEAAVREAFADAGFTPPDAFVVTPAEGTHKIR